LARLVRRSTWTFSLLTLVLLASATPVFAENTPVPGAVGIVSQTNGDGVNVRAKPGMDAEKLGTLPEGARVLVVDGPATAGDGSKWYKVQADQMSGWIINTYLARALPAKGDTVAIYGTDGTGLRLRNKPSLSSTVLTIMPEGATASIVGDTVQDSDGNAWAQLSYSGQTGYASAAFLVVKSPQSQGTVAQVQQAGPTLHAGGNAEVANTDGQGVNVRSGAGYSASILTVAPEGAVMAVLGGPKTDDQGNAWWQVDYQGVKGWVNGAYLKPTDKRPSQPQAQPAAASAAQASASAAPAAASVGQTIVSTAMTYLGAPYVWGGTTPTGFDCSGFVYYVMNKVLGGGFPRSIFAQAVSGVYVDPKSLQPGDLVFFQNTYQWGLSHVGIYIGNGKFIHAENENTGVTISEMWDGYWGPRFYTARRVGS